MRVKQLELFGFKSFATKTTLHFEPGVTAIVGPNGSGKSNVVDSIRWVLGEHNPRDVRAPRLEDVIFNGTDVRPPLSVAEVHLTIDNASGFLPIAFSEVTISRRVFRSGETECFINQAPCRLKDIRELFLGTGLGGGTYAIIEQGHIDMVLSSKPEERRLVFEEASGVAKYLAKKQETQRRLDEVEEHLVRIADIAGEVRRQVSALERQANKARQYKAQWDQLKSLELRLAADELRQGHRRFGEVERQLQALTAQRQALETQRQTQVSASEACNASVSAIQQRLQDLRAAAVACASAVEQHESQVALKTQWIADLQQQAARLETESQELSARLAQIEAEAARVGGGETELDGQRTAIEAQLAQGRGALDALEAALAQGAQALSEAKARLFEAASEASHQRNQVGASTSRLQHLDAQLGRLEGQRSQLSARAADVRERQEQAAREHDALRARAEDIQQRAGQTQEALDAAQRRRHELAGRLHQHREQLARARASVQLADDLWRRYEGFPEAVKALMGRGVEGLLGPLVDVVQAAAGYEAVVEAALGPLAEALVVRDRHALVRCREILGAEQMDGVRFIVLSDCPAQAPAVERPAQVGARAAVKEFVRAQGALQPLVDWLLNDSWVTDDFDRLMRDGTVAQSRLVSAQGERWDRRSWRVGARGTPSPSRFGRKQRWEEAQAAMRHLDQEFQRLEQEGQGAEQDWQSLLAQLEAAKGELSHVAPALHKLDAHKQQLTQDAQRLDEELRALTLEAQEATAQREASQAAALAAQQAADEAQSRQQALEQALSESQAAREAEAQRRQQLLVARAQVEASLQSFTERRDTLRARRHDLDAERAAVTQQRASKVSQRQEALARAEQLTQEIGAHRQDAQRRQQEQQEQGAEEAQVTQALREAEAARDQVLPQLLAVEQQMATLTNAIHEQSRQLSEREFRRTRLIERLRELYQIDEATLEAEVRAEAPALAEAQRAAMAEEAQKLRAKLEGLGPVSLGSVEEYDELKRRQEFLQTQQQDLTQARDDLKASITQINRTARTQFRETFEKVRQEFQHYYTRLFSGGQADLILMDEEDVLECGIDIVARPPGKRLQSISLLSGGERALTAIALLFALFKVRPSPFCILDEIDAPLDEANVDRFTRVLEEFLALSQFILITHNKKTITKADSLYGVTMQEAGVSKILSAKLASGGGNGAAAPAPSAAAPSPAAA